MIRIRWTLLFLLLPCMVFGYGNNYSLEILNIKPSGTGTPAIGQYNRIFWAYPGIEYNIQVAAIGGSYPYVYSLSNSPAGMSIGERTGIVTWANPSENASNITVRVTDRDGDYTEATWSITVSADQFIFVNDDYSGTEAGTISQPYNSIQDILDAGSGIKDKIVYFRAGTYHLVAYHGDMTEWVREYGCSLKYDGGRAYKWVAYPGESVTIDADGYFLDMSAPTPDAYFDGLNFTDGRAGFIATWGRSDYFTARRCEFANFNGPTSTNSNFGSIYFMSTHTRESGETLYGYYSIIVDNQFHDYADCAGIGSISEISHFLLDRNEFYNQLSGPYNNASRSAIALKSDPRRVTIRGNYFHDFSFGYAFGHTGNSGLYYGIGIEVCYNRILAGGHNPIFDAENNAHGPMYYYRNTVTSVFNSSNLPGSEDTMYVEACVIQNTYGGIQTYSGDPPTETNNLTCDTDTEDDVVDSSGLLVNRSLVGTYGWEIAESEYYDSGEDPPTPSSSWNVSGTMTIH